MAEAETPAKPAEAPAKVEAPAAKTEKAETVVQEPSFLKDRLERERKSVLRDLGIKVKRDEDPAARIAEYKTEKEARRAERLELKNKVAAHEATIEKLSAASAAVKVFADMEFNALTDQQKAIVTAAAGDDPNERLKTIAIMKSVPVPAPVAAAPAPIPAPAQTAPSAAAPVPASSQSVDPKVEYARLRENPRNALAAAAFLLQNRHQIYPDSK